MKRVHYVSAVLLALALASPSCRSTRAQTSVLLFEFASDRDLIPEGLAFDEASDRFFISSVQRREVVQRTRGGAISRFAAPAPAGAMLGLEVDRARGLLWGCSHARDGADALVAFDLRSGEQRRRVLPPERAEGHLLNDVEVARDGTVYVTDSRSGEVFELRAGSETLVPVAGGFRGPNGIALAADGRALFVADDDGIAVVDLHTRAATRVQAAAGVDVRGIDGLYRAGDRLVAVQNASPSMKPRVIAIDVAEQPWRAVGVTVLEDRPEILGIPTTGALAGGEFYFIAHSGLDKLDANGRISDASALVPAAIRRVGIR